MIWLWLNIYVSVLAPVSISPKKTAEESNKNIVLTIQKDLKR